MLKFPRRVHCLKDIFSKMITKQKLLLPHWNKLYNKPFKHCSMLIWTNINENNYYLKYSFHSKVILLNTLSSILFNLFLKHCKTKESIGLTPNQIQSKIWRMHHKFISSIAKWKNWRRTTINFPLLFKLIEACACYISRWFP